DDPYNPKYFDVIGLGLIPARTAKDFGIATKAIDRGLRSDSGENPDLASYNEAKADYLTLLMEYTQKRFSMSINGSVKDMKKMIEAWDHLKNSSNDNDKTSWEQLTEASDRIKKYSYAAYARRYDKWTANELKETTKELKPGERMVVSFGAAHFTS